MFQEMGHGTNVSLYPWGPPDICPPGIILPLVDERLWSLTSRTIIYFVLLIYFFFGIAILTSVLLSAIEEITSTTKKVYVSKPDAIKSKKVSNRHFIFTYITCTYTYVHNS